METLQVIANYISSFWSEWLEWWKNMAPLSMWVWLQILIAWFFIIIYFLFRKSKFVIAFELFFEQMYKFFEEIVWTNSKFWVKRYIVSLFLIILFINLSWRILDILRSMSVILNPEQRELMSQYIVTPSSMIEFNIAMAGVSIMIALIIQFKNLWAIKFIHEYIPITWKWILNIERWATKAIIYWPMKILSKIFDIWISLFVWILDIIWIGAKIVSLSARLFWNMLSGGILLWLLIVGTNSMMKNAFWIEFAFFTPLILFAQGLLVAVIQAFVFSLLCAIFVKIGQE